MGLRSENGKITWINWDNLCKSKWKEHLGIKDIRIFNKTLLAKWK